MEELPQFAYPSPFSHVEDNWDLHAVVRSCSYDLSAAASALWETFFASADSFSTNAATASPLPSTDITSPFSFSDELEEVYKPFYHEFHLLPESTDHRQSPNEPENPGHQLTVAEARAPGTRMKKRKQQEKKVVRQVTTSDAVASDMWAWRKYGQKPIKGSPYPRSYYRCSSSKGCLAKKQVERSRSDPEKFLVTYSEEHNHACPTRRSTLAGSCRSKPSAAATTPAPDKDDACCSPDSVVMLSSPVTTFAEDVDGELLGGRRRSVEGEEEDRGGNEFSAGCSNVEEEDEEELVEGRDFVFESFFSDEISEDYQ